MPSMPTMNGNGNNWSMPWNNSGNGSSWSMPWNSGNNNNTGYNYPRTPYGYQFAPINRPPVIRQAPVAPQGFPQPATNTQK